jgi:hypothetical protein
VTEYFQLTQLKKADRLWATWDSTPDDWEVSLCSTGTIEHWDGQRFRTNLAVSVGYSRRDELLIWGWFSGCLVHESLLSEFEGQGIAGYRLKPATVRFRDGRLSTEYQQLVVVGWAGVASEESGIHLDEKCRFCHSAIYSKLCHPEKLIDWNQWTGEDFFTVWPVGYMLITRRVAELLQSLKVKSFSLEEPDESWVGRNRFHVARLSSWMPDDVARKYGEPLGLENGAATWAPMSKVRRPKLPKVQF